MSQPAPRLPVPDIHETLARYLDWVRPLLDAEAYAQAEAETAEFARSEAPALQTALLEHECQSPESWLINDWRAAYLNIREPLPLASNVGFELDSRNAAPYQWAAAMAAVCADWKHGRIHAPETPQNTALCMAQWRILQGAVRVPQTGGDRIRYAENSRHIGVFHQGAYYRVEALDEHFEALPPAEFERAFAAILSDSCLSGSLPVPLPTVFGSHDAAKAFAQLRQNPDNAALLDDIETDLFHVSLFHEPTDADRDLARATFVSNQNVWCFKPLTLCANTATGRLFAHVEHTVPDGGAIKAVFARAAHLLNRANGNAGSTALPAARRWQLDGATQQNWQARRQQYAGLAQAMRVITTALPHGGHIPKGISQDALVQFLLQTAQLAVFGKIRSTYEAVDVSHFRSGRTECLRPVSDASRAFAQSLLDGTPDAAAFADALAEHKTRVKACKLGRGVHRHLLGLQLAARRAGRSPAFFDTAAYRTLCTDFLSTSTLGDTFPVTRFAFAPTSVGGFGINYAFADTAWTVTLCFSEPQQQEAVRFQAALTAAAGKLTEWLAAQF